MEGKKKTVPEIRFKGFDGEWKVTPFAELFQIIKNNTFSRDELDYGVGEYYNIHYGDILVKFIEVLNGMSKDIPHITNKAFNPSKSSLLKNGDIVIADTAEDETAGKCIEIKNLQNRNLVAGLHTIPCHPNQEFGSGYLGYYMNSPSYHTQLIKLMQGTKVLSISKTALERETEVNYPREKIEQNKIADLLSSLDSLITQMKNKYDSLQHLKETMLEKMFPKDGAEVPEIRFKGFSGAWKYCKLSELGDKTYGGGTPSTSNKSFWTGNIPWIQSSDIIDGKVFGVIPNKHISKEAINESAAQLVPKNSIAVVTRVGVGKLAFMPFSYSTSQDFLSLSNLKTESYFTTYSIYKKIKTEESAVQGTSIKGITKEELLVKQIPVPKYDEQIQIGLYFRTLDNTKLQYQQKLEKLNMMKKSLLEKMFV